MIQTIQSIFFILLLLLLLHIFSALSTTNDRCWSYNGVFSSIVAPSNWISSNGDILFHLTLKKAEIIQSLPFVGDANVHVTLSSGGDNNGIKEEAVVIVVITNLSNPNQSETYRFLEGNSVLSRSIASITGAASGKEINCRTNPATPSPTMSLPYPCPIPPQPFRDDFRGDRLDETKWLVAHKTWGSGKNGYTNGGVVYKNVSVHNGSVVFQANGSRYTGDIKGIDSDLNRKPDGKRTGGTIATRDYFGPGRYEVRMQQIWLGVWFPGFWAGDTDFDTSRMEVDWA